MNPPLTQLLQDELPTILEVARFHLDPSRRTMSLCDHLDLSDGHLDDLWRELNAHHPNTMTSPTIANLLTDFIDTPSRTREDILARLSTVIAVLQNIETDAQMALCGDWDRSDDGFEAQLDSVTIALGKLGIPPTRYTPECQTQHP